MQSHPGADAELLGGICPLCGPPGQLAPNYQHPPVLLTVLTPPPQADGTDTFSSGRGTKAPPSKHLGFPGPHDQPMLPAFSQLSRLGFGAGCRVSGLLFLPPASASLHSCREVFLAPCWMQAPLGEDLGAVVGGRGSQHILLCTPEPKTGPRTK